MGSLERKFLSLFQNHLNMTSVYIGKISVAVDPKSIVAAVSGGGGYPPLVVGPYPKAIVVLEDWEYNTKDGTVYPKKLPTLFISTPEGKISEGSQLVLSATKTPWTLEGDKYNGYIFRSLSDPSLAWVTGKPTKTVSENFMAISSKITAEKFFFSNSVDIDSLMSLSGLIVVKPLLKPMKIIPQIALLPTDIKNEPIPLQIPIETWKYIAFGIAGVLSVLIIFGIISSVL